ncbi:MAG: DUF1667 domain-containing protein [Candidatus Margulisiibacteriota bacterium]
MKTKFTCIICPVTCHLEVADGQVTGAKCKRGVAFALQEIKLPIRTITTTVRCEDQQGRCQIPVKTEQAVPLKDIPGLMKQIKQIRLDKKPRMGETIKSSALSESVVLVVTGE